MGSNPTLSASQATDIRNQVSVLVVAQQPKIVLLPDSCCLFMNRMMASRPLIGIVACRKMIESHYFHAVGEKYVAAVVEGAGGIPVPIAALGDHFGAPETLSRIDGLMLTGSYSNVEPHHYGGPASEPGTLHDPERDRTVLPLVKATLELGLPLFAICRGFQEVNVALGGTLHQAVHDFPGYEDHREDAEASQSDQYSPAHEVVFHPGGLLERLTGTDKAIVNSLHSQGIDELAPGLEIEATAPDGLIEAFTVGGAPGFNLAVQWHPEWRVKENPLSMALFGAFGNAARQRTEAR